MPRLANCRPVAMLAACCWLVAGGGARTGLPGAFAQAPAIPDGAYRAPYAAQSAVPMLNSDPGSLLWQVPPEPVTAPPVDTLPEPSVLYAPPVPPAPTPSAAPAPPAPEINPPVLRRPLEAPQEGPQAARVSAPSPDLGPYLRLPADPSPGFAGPSGIVPSEPQTDSHFVPREDRWRIGYPPWDRYGNGHPALDDYPYVFGEPQDPFNLNVLKGDYPILGQHTFLEVSAFTRAIFEAHQVPTATSAFESTARPFEGDFFNRPGQFLYTQFFLLSFDLSHGDAAFKPADWRIKVTPAFDVNYLAVNELAVVNPDVRKGTTRGRTWTTLEEYFAETKLADLSPDYDFVSLRVGSQPFTSDFRGFIFSDTNRAVRLFGNLESNRDQFNVVYLRPAEKDTNSELNTFEDRGQDIFIANFYRQDFIFPGYTSQWSFLYNHDRPSFHFDQNNFLVRPDPVGVAMPHELNVFYLGWTGDGHIDRYNIDHAFYWALGRDSRNPIANCPQDISAQMGALELSYDRDWARFRTSFFWASGDKDPNNHHATGFDSILDNPNFAGADFSYWQRQAIQLFGVNLVNRESLLADLRSSKIEGQSNFVNPGVILFNLGVDFELTPKLRMVNNINFLWFDETDVLKVYTFDGSIRHFIGTDLSVGFEYRPLLSNNIISTLGFSTLLPGRGFRDLYDHINDEQGPLFAAFFELTLAF